MTAGSAAGGGGTPMAGRAGTGVTTAPGAPNAGWADTGAGRVATGAVLLGHGGSGTDDPQATSKASGVNASSTRNCRGAVELLSEAQSVAHKCVVAEARAMRWGMAVSIFVGVMAFLGARGTCTLHGAKRRRAECSPAGRGSV